MPGFHKTRIAPTPSGYLHLGNLLSFALTFAIAGKSGAKVLLRIDDIDRQRVRSEYMDDIFDTLAFFNMRCDEGPVDAADFENNYSQQCRRPIYQSALDRLRDASLVYACTCTRSAETGCDCSSRNIPLDIPEVNWRLRTSRAASISVRNLSGDIETFPFPEDMADFVVRKKDGFPSYQLASVCDDVFFGIDLVVRGKDLFSSTLAQLHLADMLGERSFTNACFYHHPLITNGAGDKLSKSEGALSLRHLRRTDKHPSDIFRMMGTLLDCNTDTIGIHQLARCVIPNFF